MDSKRLAAYGSIFLIIFLFNPDAFAQLFAEADFLNREYVIGVGDQLSIVESRTGQTQSVVVRPDGKITIQGLEENPQAAGLKISMLKYELERRFLRYIKDPWITITLTGISPANIRITLREVIARNLEVPRGTMLGQLLRDLVPKFQQEQVPVNLEAIQLLGGVKGYKITEQSLNSLKTEGVPEDIVIILKNLQNREYTVVRQFLSDLERLLGDQTFEYRVIILQHAEAVRERIFINGITVSQGRDPNADIRVAWGDEIFIPPLAPTPTPMVTGRAEVTKQAYDDLQNFLKDYPADQKLLQPFMTIEADKVYIDQDKLPWDQLNKEVRSKLEPMVKIKPTPGPPPDLQLVGINVNLTSEGLWEAFLAFPDPNSNEKFVIKSFRKGDTVKKGETEASDLILDEIQADLNQVILKKGEDPQPLTLTLPQKFSDITFSGIVAHGGTKEAILSNFKSKTVIAPKKPIQRKRFKVGDQIEDEITLAEVSDKWVLLKKGADIQLVLLYDSQKRALQTPPATPVPAPGEQTPGTVVPPGTESPQEGALLTETLPPTSTFSCSPKKTCSEVSSCAEAIYLFTKCGQIELDENKNGIPCEETVCKGVQIKIPK